MMRALVTAGLLAVAPLAFAHTSIASAEGAQKCSDTPAKKAKKSMFGSLLGGIADSALGRAGV